jgi:hypothetical protein
VDVDPSVVPDAETSKLIQPCERPLDDSPPSPKTTAVLGATPGQQRHDLTRAQHAPDGFRVITRSPSMQTGRHRGWPRPPCSSGIASIKARASCESFRLAPVTRTASGMPCPSQIKSNAVCSRALRDRWDSAPFSRRHTPPAQASVNDGTRPINVTVTREPIQECEVDLIADALLLPIAQAPQAGHPRSAAKLLR